MNLMSNFLHVKEYCFTIASNGLECLIDETTKNFLNSSSCLDHTYVRTINKFSAKAKVLHLAITDHSLIYLTITDNVAFQDWRQSSAIFTTINYKLLDV